MAVDIMGQAGSGSIINLGGLASAFVGTIGTIRRRWFARCVLNGTRHGVSAARRLLEQGRIHRNWVSRNTNRVQGQLHHGVNVSGKLICQNIRFGSKTFNKRHPQVKRHVERIPVSFYNDVLED